MNWEACSVPTDQTRPDFDRRQFLRRTGMAAAWAVPVIVTLNASPAAATPAPVTPVASTATGPIDQTVVNTFTAVHDNLCPSPKLIKGNLRRGRIHIKSAQPKRRAHPWTSTDVQATADCLAAGPPQKVTADTIRYRCCRQVGGTTCCRIVVIDRATCWITTSFDTCDGSML